MTDRYNNHAFQAICTDLRRKNPRWSETRIRAEAKVIYHKRMPSNA